jgi:hypothetical protein
MAYQLFPSKSNLISSLLYNEFKIKMISEEQLFILCHLRIISQLIEYFGNQRTII